MYKENFNSGELGPNLWRRTRLEQHQNGCAQALNFIPLVEGPLRRRAGFWHNGLPKFSDTACRLVEYVRAADEAYVIEFGNLYTRFWGVDGAPILSAGIPYEIVSPYSAADLAGLRWKQLEDVIIFGHADGRAYKRLEKVTETSWNWENYYFTDGPWQPENTDPSKTLAASGEKGSITLTASFAYFDAGMIGTRFKLRSSTGLPGVLTWKSDEDPHGNALRLSNGRVYYTTPRASTLKTGNTPPQHDQGEQTDGILNWVYLHDNSGVCEITAVTNATTATAAVIRTLPTLGTEIDAGQGLEYSPANNYPIPATFAWSESAYNNFRGWPTAWPELREERVIVGGGPYSKSKYDASQTAGYNADNATFTPGLGTGTVLADDAIQGFVGDDSFKAMWFLSGPLLVVGTHGGESVLVGETAEAPLTPQGAKPRALTRFGSADVRPIKAQDAILFVTRGHKSLRDLNVSAFDYPGQGSDLSFIAKHIANRKFMEVAFTAAPDYILWARMGDGGLASLIYNREQNVKGWSTHALGGGCVVESLCVVPDTLGNDRLWAIVKRSKGGVDQRMIWMMSDPDDRLRLDGAVRYLGASAAGADGIDHLEGEAARVMIGSGDGRYAEAGNLTVTDGEVLLPNGETAEEIIAGLTYTSRFESLPLISETAQGVKLRASAVTVAAECVSIEAGDVNGGAGDHYRSRLLSDTTALTPQELVEELTLASDHKLDPRIYIESDDGFDVILKSYNIAWAK